MIKPPKGKRIFWRVKETKEYTISGVTYMTGNIIGLTSISGYRYFDYIDIDWILIE